MNFAPYQWRANKGYLPPPGSVPMPVTPPVAYPWPAAYPYIATGQGLQQASPAPVVYGYQTAYAPGQIGFVAVQPPPPSSKKSEKKEPKQNSDSDDDKNNDPNLPPGPPPSSTAVAPSTKSSHSLATATPTLRPGINYMYPSPSGHTILHVFSKAAPIWEARYAGQDLGFKIFKVACELRVGMVVEKVVGSERGEGWGVTEVVELGEGGWGKGTTIPYGSDKAKGTLESMGWNSKRGESLPPTWVVVHKV